MPKISAGILLYRVRSGEIEVFLVHPGGPLWAKKDLGAWSIPKGLVDSGEDPLQAARREFEEETGMNLPAGPATALQPVCQKTGKVILAWALEGDCDPSSLRSNTFSMEWPPRSGRTQEFPEIDRAAWFGIDEARQRITQGQAPLIEELRKMISLMPPSGERGS